MTDKSTYERLEKDLSTVKDDIAALTGQLTEALNTFTGTARKQAKQGYRNARENMESAFSEASERGNAAIEAAHDAAASVQDTLEDAIQHRPLAIIGLAIGLGFLIGATWRR